MNELENSHPFIEYLKEDKSRYKKASECGYIDEDDDFLIGDSGGFLMNWNINDKFVNTHLFRKPALYYEKHGVYHPYTAGSIEETKWAEKEEDIRINGLKVPVLIRNGKLIEVTITGTHYGYLNFGRIKKSPKEGSNTSIKRKVEGFPDFYDGDYWVWKIKQFCINNGFNEIYSKARRKGFTYKEGFDCANYVNLYPKASVILAAYEDKYLTADNTIGHFAEMYLDWFETQTPFVRFYLSKNWKTGFKLGFKKEKSLIEEGYLSTMWAVPCSANPSALIGKSADKIKCEESGNFPNLDKVLDVTMSTLEDGSVKTGGISLFGTGGHEGSNWHVFSDKFYNPEKISAMPFENVWDKAKRMSVCGFFFPNILNYVGYIDSEGNSNFEGALIADLKDKERQRKIEKDQKRLSIYIGQRANSPEEAFKQVTENIFSSPELILHKNSVAENTNIFYRDGLLSYDAKSPNGIRFIDNFELRSSPDTKHLAHDFINDVPFKPSNDIKGCIREYYPPVMIGGKIPDNLYRIWHDPFGAEIDRNRITASHSLQATFVYMMPNNIVDTKGDILVASYVGREDSQDAINENLIKLALRYNAKVLFERNRGETKKYFQHKKKLNLLIVEPSCIHDKVKDSMSNNYGINMTTDLKLTSHIYLKDWLYTQVGEMNDGEPIYNFHRIKDLPLLQELIMYDGTQNVDRISALLIGMFDKKEALITELKIKKPTTINRNNYFHRNLF